LGCGALADGLGGIQKIDTQLGQRVDLTSLGPEVHEQSPGVVTNTTFIDCYTQEIDRSVPEAVIPVER